ncbi:MAG: MgtC/SapB family protein [Chthoniobacterales bacterium]
MRWFIENWHLLLAKPWDATLLAFVAIISGAWVGTERQRKEKPAGLRTMALVALGSCAFTLVGYSFTSNTGDSGRVAAQIVTGIGFLGAGVLLRGPSGVQGMTTAATIWVVAAIGMTIGAGYAGGGFGLALLTRGVLTLVGRWEQSLFGGSHETIVAIVFNSDNGKTTIKLERVLAEFSIPTDTVRCADAGNERERWSIPYRLPERHHHEFLAALADMPQVVAIERPTCPVISEAEMPEK